ncbi:MAG: aminoglycoside phosphotransferase family protein [Thermomicrobiales bacterium]
MPDAPPDITIDLVRTLITDQFPQWAHLPIRPVTHSGWDNRTFHLGELMTVRLPSAEGYAGQVAKEQRWLPILAPRLPIPIPTPLGLGAPTEAFPWPWSIYGWIDGETVLQAPPADLVPFAKDLAAFLSALQRIDATGGPAPGPHNFWRGGPLAVYADEAHRAIATLAAEIDAQRAGAIVSRALKTAWTDPPVWFHGDIAVGNLLVEGSHLRAVIDFGTSGVGDPACDLAIAWNLFQGESRQAFRDALPLDAATWERGAGWALWKAAIVVANVAGSPPPERVRQRRVIAEILADPLI